MSQIYLSLGTNLGDRLANLQLALQILARHMTITAVSSLYETEPWGITDQPSFLNLCMAGFTSLKPHQLLDFCQTVETEVGRQPTYKWGPRLIDIDILFYDNLIMKDDTLSIPHPFVGQRAFVLTPLAEIAAEYEHPQTQQSVAQMLAYLSPLDEATTAVYRLPHQPAIMSAGG